MLYELRGTSLLFEHRACPHFWYELQFLGTQVGYKRYASLYFVMGIEASDNELITLEVIHEYVEVLDRYFGNVCELDLIFNFHKVCRMRNSSTHGLRLSGLEGSGCSAWLVTNIFHSTVCARAEKSMSGAAWHVSGGCPGQDSHIFRFNGLSLL
jgi:hypothetical protein